jgi:AcrR family transcriptional regulator
MMKRLTRKESQAHTRECLMRSAGHVFARRGLQQASIDEVAEDAGFTKGAFYANFKNKEELFLAMLDERFAKRLEDIEAAIAAEGDATEKARLAGDSFVAQMRADPEWERLFLEFSAYAARDEDFREELVTRYRAMVDRIAAALQAHSAQMDKQPVLPYQQVSQMCCVMANGFALEKLLDPESVPDEMYGTLLAIFFAGLDAIAHGAAPATAGASA